MSYQVGLTLVSRNAKTGPIPVSTTTKETCPIVCPLIKGCYGKYGPLNIFWNKISSKTFGMKWDEFCKAINKLRPGTLWRHNQVGDLPGTQETVDREALSLLVKANKRKRGFTFTHYDVISNDSNRESIKAANEDGFTINLSANNLAHADSLLGSNCGPVVTILPKSVRGKSDIYTPNGNRVVVCPATYKDDVTCESCALCQKVTRKVIVGFPSHGVATKIVDSVANNLAS